MKKKVFLIGAGGAGMSAVAKYLYTQGFLVVGSDATHTPIIKDLEDNYGFIFRGDQSAENIRSDIDFVVYTPAVGEGNSEWDKAKLLGLQMYSYPQYLGVISESKKTIAIAGTNGKTTTTTMVAETLVNLGVDPTVIVGGVMSQFDTNYKEGGSDYFVVEACEYKNSFLSLAPSIAVITNITPDHLDYFGTYENYKNTFSSFVKKIVPGGTLVCNVSDPELQEVLEIAHQKGLTVIDYSEEIEMSLPIPGVHNIQNAQAAVSVCRALGLQTSSAQEYLSNSFRGSKRRFEYKGKTEQGFEVFDDYAHNPEALDVLVAGIRERYPEHHVAMFFQPHLFSRTQEFFDGFVTELGNVDTLFLLPIYHAREEDDGTMSSVIVSEGMKLAGSDIDVVLPRDFQDAAELFFEKKFPKKTIVLTVGAGDVYQIGGMIVK